MNKILFSGTISLILIITAFFIPIEWVQKPIFLLGIISIYTLLRKRYTVMDYLHHQKNAAAVFRGEARIGSHRHHLSFIPHSTVRI